MPALGVVIGTRQVSSQMCGGEGRKVKHREISAAKGENCERG